MNLNTFACYNNDEEIRLISSSGGIYYLLASKILDYGGSVYSTCYSNDLKAEFKKIENIKDLKLSCGSKYMPSSLGDTFSSIKKELNSNRIVLFVGLPCQCQGLKSYIGNSNILNEFKDNLILIDLVCHGVPSSKAWESYSKSLKNRGFNISKVNMRNKSSGWRRYCFHLVSINGKNVYESHGKNLYMKGFISDIYLRPSCNDCNFKGVNRNVDITLGDYWGIQNIHPEMDDDKGTSLVLVHTEKGLELYRSISDKISYISTPIEEAIKHNTAIVESAKLNNNRADFFVRLSKGEDFMNIVNDLTKIPLYRKILNKILCSKNFFGGVKP
ncbi:MAG: Coenzyme F420 hydrogenase/dehydrogenase, beta subunit C-terminal domain [Erysipelotrichaceae bacterium]|nr:Coenzyme F420 hydrogenase/dehydrogenase, beta subunit C-terminal domain [Erysipelotrichaceae bacterium]